MGSNLWVPEERRLPRKRVCNIPAGIVGHRVIRADGTETPWEYDLNGVVAEGREHVIKLVFLNTGIQEPSWFIGIYDDASVLADTDTADAIQTTGINEITDTGALVETQRQAWTPGTLTSDGGATPPESTVDNSASVATFTFDGSVTVQGAFLVSVAAFGNSTGEILYATVDFAATQAVNNGDTLEITWTQKMTDRV